MCNANCANESLGTLNTINSRISVNISDNVCFAVAYPEAEWLSVLASPVTGGPV